MIYCFSVGCAVLVITTGKKKIQSSVLQVVLLYCVSFWFWREIGSFFVVVGNFHYDWKKKRYSRLSGGCAIIITTGKKRYITTGKKRYSRLSDRCAVLAITTGKKKDTVICLAGCAVVLVFGSGGKLAFFL